jgi:hypothetical protein
VVYESSDGESTFHLSLSVPPISGYARFYFSGQVNGKLYVQAVDSVGRKHPHSKVLAGASWTDGPDLGGWGSNCNVFADKMVYQIYPHGQGVTHLCSFDGATVTTVIESTLLCYTIYGSELLAVYKPPASEKYVLAQTSDLINWKTISENINIAWPDPGPPESMSVAEQHIFLGTASGKVYRSTFELSDNFYGDVSGDGKITAYDAVLVLQYVLGLIELSDDQQKAARVTDDDNITILDAALILQYITGLITHFPVETQK